MQSSEQWKPVVGFEGYYEVSDQGRVRSVDRIVERSHGRRYLIKGRILATSINQQTGRRIIRLSRTGMRKTTTIYPLVLEAFVGARPPGADACHNDGNPLNDRLDNLRWDTRSGNMRDTLQHGTHYWASREDCARGHLLIGPNLALRKGRPRVCRACERAYSNAKSARRRGVAFDLTALADDHYARIMKE